jgi:arylsulfatase A
MRLPFLAALLLASSLPAASPNIIVILADDLGYGDVSCYNPRSKIQTPHIDRLAAEGVRFTDAHTPSSVCTPTRYGLLTGRYCWRTRLKSGVLDGFSPPLIEPSRLTVASFLKQHGYTTACVGKWHLGLQWTRQDGSPENQDRGQAKGVRPGENIDYSKPFSGGPLAVGFDHYFGISASLNMPPFCFLQGDRVLHPPALKQDRIRDDLFAATDEGLRSPDFTNYSVMPRLTGEAVRFIESHTSASTGKPFFLYAPLTSPHLPVVTNQEYRGKSQAGEYGDFVIETDAFVGAILDTLDRFGLARDTLVLFTSDNGGLFHYWEPREADDLKHYKIAGRAAHIRQFEHQGNAHLRGTKADIWEGGHRVPFIARWPAAAPAPIVSSQLVELTDLLATTADILGAALPPGAGPDSRSFLHALTAQKSSASPRDFAVHHSISGVFAIREGPWKLVPGHRGSAGFTKPAKITPAPGEPGGQLYHLDDDPSETNNVFARHPDILARLSTRLKQVQDAATDPP